MTKFDHRPPAPVTGSRRRDGRKAIVICVVTIAVLISLVSGCATAPLERAGTLSSYDNLKPTGGMLTKSLSHADAATLKRANTVRLMPIVFSEKAARSALAPAHQDMIANATGRALCNSLSRKFRVVMPDQLADLTITGTITYVAPTDGAASAVSQVASVASSIIVPIPVPLPRLPIGMGGLSVEAEARDVKGKQVAAVVWARGADAFTSKARVSPAGDSYDLATSFSDDFSQLLKHGTAETTAATFFDQMPSVDDISYAIDGKATAPACATYGNGPGILGWVGSGFGAPPAWTDKGPTSNSWQPKQ